MNDIPNMPPPPAHSAGRLTRDEFGLVLTESGQPLRASKVMPPGHGADEHCLAEAEANARRLVALWNACEAIPTAALERGAVERLVEALRQIAKDAPAVKPEWGDYGKADESEANGYDLAHWHFAQIARAALAQVAGQEETKS